MQGTVFDYSAWRPTDQQYIDMRAAGIVGFVRYPYVGSGTDWKAIQRAEYQKLLDFGFHIALTPELTKTTWRGGRPAGLDLGAKARAWAHNIGHPDSCPMHFAVDENVLPSELNLALDFLHACAEAGAGVGKESAYGESSVVDAAFEQGITCNAWRAAATAWDSVPSKHASMFQLVQKTYPQFPPSYDENLILKPDWGQHPAPSGATMALPFTLWQTSDGKCWRVDAGGQSKVLVPDGLNHVAFNFGLMTEGGDPSPRIRQANTPEAVAYLNSIPVSGAVVLPPLPPYPVPPTPNEIAAATVTAIRPVLNSQRITTS